MELQVGVKVLLKNSEGKYLLLKRSPEKYPEVENPWDIVGGRIDPGISLFENLKREVKEETSLSLEKEPRLVAAQDILKVADRHVIRLTYIGDIEGEPTLDEDHSEYKWFTVDELRGLDGLDDFFEELLDSGDIKL